MLPLIGILAAMLPPILPQAGNIVARFSAASIAQGDNTAVTTWTDSIAGVQATQGTGVNQPKYMVSSAGGKPCVRFAGSQWLQLTTPGVVQTTFNSQIYSCAIIFNNATGNTGQFSTMFGAYQGGNVGVRYFADGSTTAGLMGKFGGGSLYVPRKASTADLVTMLGTSRNTAPYPMTGTGMERVYIDGGCITSSGAAGQPYGTVTGAIGAISSAGANSFKGDVYEIIIWNTELAPADSIALQRWVANQYGTALPWITAGKFRIFDGDSITAGLPGQPKDSYPFKVAASLGIPYGSWSNIGVGGISMTTMNNRSSYEVDALNAAISGSVPVRIFAFEWANQWTNVATAESASSTYITNRKAHGSKVIFGTSTDRGDGTDDAANRAAYDAYWDSNIWSLLTAGSDNYVPIHTNVNIGVEGACPASPTPVTIYYDTGRLHLSATGYTELAGLFYAADIALP